MLHDPRVCDGVGNIRPRDLDMAFRLARIIQKDAIANNMRFALGEVAPATESDERAAIACTWWDEEGEEDTDE